MLTVTVEAAKQIRQAALQSEDLLTLRAAKRAGHSAFRNREGHTASWTVDLHAHSISWGLCQIRSHRRGNQTFLR